MNSGEQSGSSGAYTSEVEELLSRELSKEQLWQLEQARAYPMELDMSFAEQGDAILSELSEGIYRLEDTAARYLSPYADKADRARLNNVIHTNQDVFPLNNGEFYVKGLPEPWDMTVLERADAIIDRISTLCRGRPGLRYDDVIYAIQKEGVLLSTDQDTFAMTDAICRRHPRLTLQQDEGIGPDAGLEKIIAIRRKHDGLPRTAGESLEWALRAIPGGTILSGDQWIERISDGLLYQPHTIAALHRLIQLTPKLVLARKTDNPGTDAYMYLTKNEKWLPLPTEEHYKTTSIQELARRALDTCHAYDLQTADEIIARLTNGVAISETQKQEIIEALLYDPRVHRLEGHEQYLQILHSAKDDLKYRKTGQMLLNALKVLRKKDGGKASLEDVYLLMRAEALSKNVKFPKSRLLFVRSLLDVEPSVTYLSDQETYMLQAAPVRPTRTVRWTPEPKRTEAEPTQEPEPAITETEPSVSPQKLEVTEQRQMMAAQLAADRVAILDDAAARVIEKHIDKEATSSMSVERLVRLAESMLEQETGNAVSDEDKKYLTLTFADDDLFDVSLGLSILHVRPSGSTTGLITGVPVSVDGLRTSVFKKKR